MSGQTETLSSTSNIPIAKAEPEQSADFSASHKKRGPVSDRSSRRTSSEEVDLMPNVDDEVDGDVKPKKIGRKNSDQEPSSKRKAQNRAAQRAFRKRKEDHLKALETQVVTLKELHSSTTLENDQLRQKVRQLEEELRILKDGSFTFEMSLPHRNPSLSSLPTTGFSSNFAHMKDGISPQSNLHLSPNSIEKPNMHQNVLHNDRSADNLNHRYQVPPTLVDSNSAQGTLSPETPSSSDSPSNLYLNYPKRKSITHLHHDCSALSNGENGEDVADGKQFCQKLSTACGSIACSMLTKTTPHRASVDILSNLHESTVSPPMADESVQRSSEVSKSIPNVELSLNVNQQFVSPFGGTDSFPLPTDTGLDSLFEPDSAIENSHLKNVVMEPELFQAWREPAESLDKEFFNDEGEIDDVFHNYFHNSNENGDLITNSLHGLDFLENANESFPEQMYPFIKHNKDYISNHPDEVPPDGLPQKGKHDTSSQMPSENEIVPAKERAYLSCPKVWSKIINHPRFESFDIDDLCSKLKNKAKCSSSGVLLDERDVEAALNQFN
ncbi:DNA-binding transcription factor, oxidative stress-responsive Pap1/Caf3 [Schizosaccharomyces pombe]|uniref:AP-1-like transcription factor n=2 Tax=Schizosaccharomyces pombe TaxID=4896 RepID=AP1_SCHPO|nr:transcription factor Pap1/Caf3 [Schizosaccharomyces pombe]Q01663.2 RecName: Full=AP-1-like transcription factor; AltName: Full=Caffeine resistance protein 3 [Schizosaccharomyces pombe 972h-]CAB66170.1 transcription factor Pap1/Caf3 [Schizosaccharomyces pombe]|eukprot:NP_593662.1 transcription factor Pap1/Caf3 [Schizosaccharomyces pombe]